MEDGVKRIMGRKLFKVLVVVFFPITIFCCIAKLIFKRIKKRCICRYISQIDITKIDSLDGHAFEEFLYLFLQNNGYSVEKTPKSRDYGADLIINLKNEKVVIQCKNYYNHNVGNSAVQEIATAKDYYNATIGIVITNWFFTTPAQTLADKVGVKLIDRNSLSQILTTPCKLKHEYLSSY